MLTGYTPDREWGIFKSVWESSGALCRGEMKWRRKESAEIQDLPKLWDSVLENQTNQNLPRKTNEDQSFTIAFYFQHWGSLHTRPEELSQERWGVLDTLRIKPASHPLSRSFLFWDSSAVGRAEQGADFCSHPASFVSLRQSLILLFTPASLCYFPRRDKVTSGRHVSKLSLLRRNMWLQLVCVKQREREDMHSHEAQGLSWKLRVFHSLWEKQTLIQPITTTEHQLKACQRSRLREFVIRTAQKQLQTRGVVPIINLSFLKVISNLDKTVLESLG